MDLPNIPDNLYKFLLIAGIGLIVYSYFESLNFYESYNKKIDKHNELITNTNLLVIEGKQNLEKIEKKANLLAKKFKIDNPITRISDSTVTFNQVLSGPEIDVEVSDSLSKLFEFYENGQYKILLEKERLKFLSQRLLEAEDELENKENANNIIVIFGIILFLIGLESWRVQQSRIDELKKIEIAEKGKLYKYCQSCGKTFSSMVTYGKLEDNKKQFAFCSNCFDKGKFKKNLTKEDFEFMKKEAIEKQSNWIRKRIVSKRFDSLERWIENEYD